MYCVLVCMVVWGVWFGVVVGGLIVVLFGVFGIVFMGDLCVVVFV